MVVYIIIFCVISAALGFTLSFLVPVVNLRNVIINHQKELAFVMKKEYNEGWLAAMRYMNDDPRRRIPRSRPAVDKEYVADPNRTIEFKLWQ